MMLTHMTQQRLEMYIPVSLSLLMPLPTSGEAHAQASLLDPRREEMHETELSCTSQFQPPSASYQPTPVCEKAKPISVELPC